MQSRIIYIDCNADGVINGTHEDTFNSDGLITQRIGKDDDGSTDGTDTFVYDSNGYLIENTYTDNNYTQKATIEYDANYHPTAIIYKNYDSDGTLTSESTYSYEYTYTDEALVSKVVKYRDGEKQSTRTVEYGYNDSLSGYGVFLKEFDDDDNLENISYSIYATNNYYKNCLFFIDVLGNKNTCDKTADYWANEDIAMLTTYEINDQFYLTLETDIDYLKSFTFSSLTAEGLVSLFSSSDASVTETTNVKKYIYEFDSYDSPTQLAVYNDYSSLDEVVSDTGSSASSADEYYYYQTTYWDGTSSSYTSMASGSTDGDKTAEDDGDEASGDSLDDEEYTPEVCDGVDNDGDGDVDEGLLDTYYLDADEDGEGDDSLPLEDCEQPVGYVANNDDCDDTDAEIYSDNSETCDGKDNDCDGSVDEGLSTANYYLDADEDGYGDPSDYTTECAQPEGYVDNDEDCDDSKASVRPGRTEICKDLIDNDCDDTVDESDCLLLAPPPDLSLHHP